VATSTRKDNIAQFARHMSASSANLQGIAMVAKKRFAQTLIPEVERLTADEMIPQTECRNHGIYSIKG